ncbi:aldose 1-epimerase family protein [Microbacterium marinum]|uniref:DUF4432 family protein n=1 Tax=Microbacterium marinum TaxID=421115 RepID=UPI003850D187
MERSEGPGRGSRVARISMMGGLDLELLPDRGMDIGATSWQGTPLAWVSPADAASPALLDPGSEGWRRSFGGGLLVTCGLDQFGIESTDAGSVLPMHGRAHRLPATGFHTWSKAAGDDWQIGAAGETRQATPFDENLRLTRSVCTSLRDRSLRISDEVSNDGHTDWPHMLLYHFNFGWPLIAEGTRISIRYELDGTVVHCKTPEPRDDDAQRGLDGWDRVDHSPQDGPEQVFSMSFPPGAEVSVLIESRRAGLSATLRFNSSELPMLYLWKWLRPGANVLGVEPANCAGIRGRASARAEGGLPTLGPDETRAYELRLDIRALV